MLKQFSILTVLAISLVAGTADAETVSAHQFWQLHRSAETGNPMIVDVRSNEEYLAGHLPNAVNVPYDEISKLIKIAPDKSQAIFLYCHSGRRAAIAETELSKLGYSQLYNGESYQKLLSAMPSQPYTKN